MYKYWITVVCVVALFHCAQSQLTAQSSVASDLIECYNDATLLNTNNLPPTTIPVLIDIIRKIEDNPNVNKDLRQLAVILLHTYRQDGIEYHQPDTNQASANVLFYAPTFHSFYRHRLLLTKLIPSNLDVLSNNTLSSVLKCSLHRMISTTVDARVRGDESSCNQLSQYRALRTARQVSSSVRDDVEILDESLLYPNNRNGQMRQWNGNNDVEYTSFSGSMSERQLLGESQCPLLNGVVKSAWGAVSAGHLIAGIAAGAESQQVSITELTKNTPIRYDDVQSTVTSLYPATLSGDLAEAALIQGTERGLSQISVGTAGNWNSTEATRHFMIHNRVNVEMTDPEIRGDIDGFVLGTVVQSALSTYGSLKLSQIIDMYYSPRNGVFNPTLRACNRRELSQQYITNTNLETQTYAFAAALDTNMPLRGTITGGLRNLVTSAVTNFQTYATNNLNDLSCITTETTSADYRLKTNLYIVLDASWQYTTIYPAISYLLDTIEVGKYGSSVTLLSAFDGNIVVNKTFSLADFHTEYTLAKHQTLLNGVNLQTSFTNIRTLMHAELENEKTHNYVGGNATVLLFLLSTSSLQNNDLVLNEARILNETVPDLRILFATSTNQFDNLWNLVRDMHNDIKTISLSSSGINVETTMASVVDRIAQTGRRIVNSNCGSEFLTGQVSGSRHFDDYVEPGYINFYSISPNYIYGRNDNRRIRISRTSTGIGSLVVCFSRSVTQPRQNSTSNVIVAESAIHCETITSNGNVEYGLQNPCDGYSTINSCPWFYVSVQSVPGTATTSATCTEEACRFPYNIKYQIQIEEFDCYSGAGNIVASILLVLTAVIFSMIRV